MNSKRQTSVHQTPKPWRTFWRSMLSFACPSRCLHCEIEIDTARELPLCEHCSSFRWNHHRCPRCGTACHPHDNKNQRCSHCRRVQLNFDRFTSLGPYKTFLRKGILKSKYQQEILHLRCIQMFSLHFPAPPPTVVISYIPSHKKRMKQRGTRRQHLPEMIESWAQTHQRDIVTLLNKSHFDRPQVLLNAQERRQQSSHGFVYVGPKPAPHEVWIFDDVYTTGSTMKHACQCLKAAGVQSVHALSFALADQSSNDDTSALTHEPSI